MPAKKKQARIAERLNGIRKAMQREHIQAYLVPSTDPHKSEYVPDTWQRRKWLTGFTGSAGELAVTLKKAALWTDSRYFLQAGTQLKGSTIGLMRMGQDKVPNLEEWLVSELRPGNIIGVDPSLLCMDDADKLEKAFERKGLKVRYIEKNLVDELWTDRPPIPGAKVWSLDVRYCGEPVAKKLARLREKMKKHDTDAFIIASLDEVAWLYNLRGQDSKYNPIFIAYALVTLKEAYLFIEQAKLAPGVRGKLKNVTILPYDSVYGKVGEMAKKGARFWADPKTTNHKFGMIMGKCDTLKELSPVSEFKSVKNPTEIKGFADTAIVEGVALARYFHWLEMSVGKTKLTEISTARKLEEFFSKGKHYAGLSFAMISSYKDHGAIIHYSPTPETDVSIRPEGIYLLDAGAQFWTGTTDITRTITLGKPTSEQKEMFTRVLKGHIDLALLRFPRGFSGRQIEMVARKPLWDVGQNYGHGTGHGVGHYLICHEGPMSLTPRDTGIPLKEGNVMSNEPGYYKDGEYGMRTENIVIVEKALEFSKPGKDYLKFRTITLCPIDVKLVETKLLTDEELAWLNEYHTRVYTTLAPHLDNGTKAWLRGKTRAVK